MNTAQSAAYHGVNHRYVLFEDLLALRAMWSWECGVRSCACGGYQEGAGEGATVVKEQGVVEEQAADGGVLGG